MGLQVYFVRHGKTVWNVEKRMQGWQNSPLTSKGELEADLLGKAMAQMVQDSDIDVIDRIYTSPSKRAIRTSEHLNHFLKTKLEIVPEFQELNMGDWEGQYFAAIEAKNPKEWHDFWFDQFHYQPNNRGETFDELSKRVRTGFDRVAEEVKDGTIVIVSHRIAIRFLISSLVEENVLEIPDPKSTSLSHIRRDERGVYAVDFLNRIVY